MTSAVRAVLSAIAVAALCGGPAAAVEGDWATGEQASVRLIAAGIDDTGRLNAGIEIEMPDGWHTYWRAPGDAGIAPAFDFSASRNAGAAEIAFPLPARLDDGFTVTNVYKKHILLPVSIAIPDPASPVALSVNVAIGVCSDICIPAELTATLAVPAGEHDASSADRLAAVRTDVPGEAVPGTFSVEHAVREGGSDRKPVFRITATVPHAEDAALFVEGPADWAPYAPVRMDDTDTPTWLVKFSRRGAKTPIAGAELRVTLASGGRGIEQVVKID